MRTEVSIEELLRWRLASAQTEAPPGPHAAELLASARPWWEIYPERFEQALHSVMALETAVGAALASAAGPRAFDPVPAIIVRGDERIQAYAGIQCFKVGDGRLHFRFFLDACANPVENSYEVTFVSSCPKSLSSWPRRAGWRGPSIDSMRKSRRS